MSISAEQVLSRSFSGSDLIFREQVIAEITSKQDGLVVIQDIHKKSWQIRLARLQAVTYPAFMADLVKSIVKAAPQVAPQGSARAFMSGMNVGDHLSQDGKNLATLVGIQTETDFGPELTLRDLNGNLHEVYVDLLPNYLTLNDYLEEFEKKIENDKKTASEPLLFSYFKDEFIPKMLAQLAYDHECWGDTWLLPPPEGQEVYIFERFKEYFERFEQFSKDIPWLMIARDVVIAQAREDHPDWLL